MATLPQKENPPSEIPRSAYDTAGGMSVFPRMLSKIRLHAKGTLHKDYHDNLGKGSDGWCCNFLRVDYDALKTRVLEGGTDEEILEWCYQTGRRLNEGDLLIWNQYVRKVGWNDFASALLQKLKEASGFAERDDILTMMDYFEVDEGRKPRTLKQ
ncbi:MAG: DUF5069 domain-containing protein [Chthoniobacterales bacterium]